MKKLRVLAWLWVSVLLGAGLAGGLVMSRVGFALAMSLAIYGGNTEPARPELSYPWIVFALALVVSVSCLAWGLRDAKRGEEERSLLRRFGPLAAAYLGGLLAALLPFIHLFRLFDLIA
jgi:uncharacterized membrane protein YedE/YeeE